MTGKFFSDGFLFSQRRVSGDGEGSCARALGAFTPVLQLTFFEQSSDTLSSHYLFKSLSPLLYPSHVQTLQVLEVKIGMSKYCK